MRDPLASIRPRRAFALVIVLIFVALTMILVLSLLTQANTDQTLIHSQAEKHRAAHLADSAVAIALTQLREATEQRFSPETPKPWTSQPGAIRVHTANGQLETLYKLYSARTMKITNLADLPDDMPPPNWAAMSHLFVDLNAPVSRGADLHFPILDPRAAGDDLGAPVEGFSYETTGAPVGTVGAQTNPNARRLPMPVRWLYLLQDGSIGNLTNDGQFVGANPAIKPTVRNPIVSRVAFWMDDESCKINVNTAAEGAFWDTPRADTDQERDLGSKQPTRLEYQRQPGHPAGVCLSSVLLPGQRFHPDGFSSEMPAMSLEDSKGLWRIGRLMIADKPEGTSQGGTVIATSLASNETSPEPRARQFRYGDFGDVLFDSAPKAAAAEGEEKKGPLTRPRQDFFVQNPLAVRRLSRASGFLTAESAAPEITLFGTPRIALWPVHANTPEPGKIPENEQVVRYTRYDQTAVLAATFGDERYLVQRSDPGNGSMDLEEHANGQNLKILDYLRRLTDRPIPGNFSQGSANATFAAKYGTDPDTGDRDNILLSMLDYVRSTNFADGHLAADTQFSILCPGEPHFGFGQLGGMQRRFIGSGLDSTKSDVMKGMGRMMTISEVALIITCRAQVNEDKKIVGQATTANRSSLKNPGDRELEVGFLVEGFLPEQGWADYRPYASVTMVGGLPGAALRANDPWPALSLNDQPLVPDQNNSVLQAEARVPVGWRGWGGSTGVRGLSKGVITFKSVVIKADAEGNVPSLSFQGGSSDPYQLKLALYDTDFAAAAMVGSASDLVQVIPLKLPDILPDPEAPESGLALPALPVGMGVLYPMANRMKEAVTKGKSLLTTEDIVQSLVPAHGDYRLVAGRRWVESRTGNVSRPLFAAHPQWGKQRQAHALRDPSLNVVAGLPQAGALKAGLGQEEADPGFFYYQLQVPSAVMPDFPQAQGLPMKAWLGSGWSLLSPESLSDTLRLDGGVRGQAWPNLTGDFDNGSGNSPDGPYTNRPDDGNRAASSKSEVPYFSPDATSQLTETVPPVTLAGFSAQRMLPSPLMFGGLPTGVRSQVPWQTLLFRPQPDHYGAVNPPDHLLLDLFWSPVLEPEPVSRPFETEGKINLNHPLVPFGYIHRATALHAAMKAETLLAIPDTAAATYKTGGNPTDKFRHYLDAAGTVKVWKDNVFDAGRVFLTPGEICEYPLIPEGTNASVVSMQNFWGSHRLTGDNSKERPYAHLYSRLTTKSNSFRLHYVVETLKKARSSDAARFDLDKDRVTARQQGTCLLRRHLDYKQAGLPNYLVDANAKSLTNFYRWEILAHRPLP